jgi:hypothetical protein
MAAFFVIIVPSKLVHTSEFGRNVMGKAMAILLGVAAMAGGVLLIIFVWGDLVVDLILACIPLILLFGGLIAFIAGISSMKDAARAKSLEEETEEGFQSVLEDETSEIGVSQDNE